MQDANNLTEQVKVVLVKIVAFAWSFKNGKEYLVHPGQVQIKILRKTNEVWFYMVLQCCLQVRWKNIISTGLLVCNWADFVPPATAGNPAHHRSPSFSSINSEGSTVTIHTLSEVSVPGVEMRLSRHLWAAYSLRMSGLNPQLWVEFLIGPAMIQSWHCVEMRRVWLSSTPCTVAPMPRWHRQNLSVNCKRARRGAPCIMLFVSRLKRVLSSIW